MKKSDISLEERKKYHESFFDKDGNQIYNLVTGYSITGYCNRHPERKYYKEISKVPQRNKHKLR